MSGWEAKRKALVSTRRQAIDFNVPDKVLARGQPHDGAAKTCTQ